MRDADALVALAVKAATDVILARYVEERNQIGAAIVDADGRVFTGIHLEAMVGRASSCAEASALANATIHGHAPLYAVAALRHPKPAEPHVSPRLVPPCGLCRELLLDYGPDLKVVLPSDDTHEVRRLSDLFPHKYVGTKWNGLHHG